MKKQILVVHGGDFFDTRAEYVSSLKKEPLTKADLLGNDADKNESEKRWKDNLSDDLGGKFEIFFPEMPSPDNAKYAEWKIMFEKTFEFLRDDASGIILVGHSLGGIFLARYLSQNIMPVKVSAVFFLAAPYLKPDTKNGLRSNAGFSLSGNFKKLESQTENIFILHSKDDHVVDPKHACMYKEGIKSAKLVMLDKLGHFRQKHFTELVKEVEKLS